MLTFLVINLVACECTLLVIFVQLYLHESTRSSSIQSTPGLGDGASTATVSQKTPIYVVTVRRRQSLSIISLGTAPFWALPGHYRGIALRAII